MGFFTFLSHRLYDPTFISFCGDIHLNPGPNDFLCGLCGELVSDDDRAICCEACDGCNKWIHVSCDQYTTEEAYGDFVLNPSTEPWFCNICIGSNMEDSSETQKPNNIYNVFVSMLEVFFLNIMIY